MQMMRPSGSSVRVAPIRSNVQIGPSSHLPGILNKVAREVRAVGGFQLTLTQYRLDFALFSAELVPATDHPLPKWHLHSLGVRDTKSRVALYIEHFSCDSHH